jgi:hypothetical protein
MLNAGRRLQALERKIEELAARQDHQLHHTQESMPTQLFNHETRASTSSGVSQWSISADTPSSSEQISGIPSANSSAGATKDNGDILDRGVVTQELAQALLDRFRANGAQQFPFVAIPADMSLQAIRRETPLLFLAISATMIFDYPFLQHQLGEEFRQKAFEKVLWGAEKSLELLQGLLLYTSWYCHFYRADRHQEFLLSQLCITLAHELGFDKSKKRQIDPLHKCKPVSNTEPSSSVASAQMRAYLGTYCVSCL